MPKTYIVNKNCHNLRFDKWFKLNILSLPQSLVERIIRQNKVRINKKKAKSSERLKVGDEIDIYDISKFKKIFKN